MKILKILLQIVLLYGILLLGTAIGKMLGTAIPGSIIGIAILFLLLQFKIIKLEWVEAGANVLLAELLLFFIPSTLGIIDYNELFGVEGIKVFAVIGGSLFIVMIVTGYVAEWTHREKKGGDDNDVSSSRS